MSEMVDLMAREIAMEIMEIYAPDEAAAFKWPDDASGDTIDRARSRAQRIIAALPDLDDRTDWQTYIDDALAKL